MTHRIHTVYSTHCRRLRQAAEDKIEIHWSCKEMIRKWVNEACQVGPVRPQLNQTVPRWVRAVSAALGGTHCERLLTAYNTTESQAAALGAPVTQQHTSAVVQP